MEASAYKEDTVCTCSMCKEGFRHHRATCQKYEVRQTSGCLHPVQQELDAYLSETSASPWGQLITNHSKANFWPQQITLQVRHGVLKQTRSHIARARNISLPCWIVRIFGHCVSHFADNVLQTFLWQVNFLRTLQIRQMHQKTIARLRQVSRISSENLTSQNRTSDSSGFLLHVCRWPTTGKRC